MKRIRHLAWLPVCLLLAAALAGCGSGKDDKPAPSKAAPAAAKPETPASAPAAPAPAAPAPAAPAKKETYKVKVGGTDRDAIKHLSLYLMEGNIGKQEGLEIEFKEYKGGSQVANALLSGEVDFTFMAVSHVLKDNSGELRFLGLVTKYPGSALVIASSERGKIKSVADLKGQKVGVSSLGSGPHQLLMTLLETNNIDKKDVIVLPVGNDPREAIKEGKVVAAFSQDPFVTEMVKRDTVYVLVDARTAEGTKQLYGVDAMPWIGLTTRKDVLDKNPGAVQAMVNALVKAQKFISERTAAEIVALVPAEIKANEALYTAIVESNQKVFSPDATVTKEELNHVWKDLQATNAVPKDKPLPWDDVTAFTFLEKAKLAK